MKYLIVIDMQYDFITGALGNFAAQQIVFPVMLKIEECRAAGYRIIFTKDIHSDNYLDTFEGKKLPTPHCIEGTHGCEIIYPIFDNDAVFEKSQFTYGRWGIFQKDDVVEIVGVCTDICVICNALMIKARNPETQIIVDGYCCAGTTQSNHDSALNILEACQIEVI